MSEDAKDLRVLIELFAQLPNLGPRSSRRLVLHLVKKRTQKLLPLADAIQRVAQSIRNCGVCGNLCSAEKCAICANENRATGEICVVEDVGDLWALERSGGFCGRYHVLGGVLSMLDDVGPDDLRIPALLDRVQVENASEIILAMNATVEGQTTAHYIADRLEELDVRVTSLGQGVPVGGELDYLDDRTISAALSGRKAY